jgi:hypothetical protein
MARRTQGASFGLPLPVRITSLRGDTFRGRLVAGPASKALPELKAGRLLTFVAGQIHSIPREHAARKRPEETDNRGRLTRAASTTNAITRKQALHGRPSPESTRAAQAGG